MGEKEDGKCAIEYGNEIKKSTKNCDWKTCWFCIYK